MLVFDNVWFTHMISPDFCRDQNEAFGLLLFGQWIYDFQSRLRDGGNPILDSYLRESPEIKSHHIGGDFLMF